MEQNIFKRWNRIVGWSVFAVAALTYLLTIEPSSSLWDCGEFVATSYKLEVGHPPGAPLFMLLARIATMFAPSTYYVPHMVNGMNALASAFCILFLFWTITHIARRLLTREGRPLSVANGIAILGAGAVGALAYTFTDTFWFSAVEGEVYAMSSLVTALVFWCMTKWYDEADTPYANRWIVLISFLMGLSIGIHLLNLLAIPALVFMFYYKQREDGHYSAKEYLKIFAVSVVILGIILFGIIPYLPKLAAYFDLFFVNTLGLPFNSGAIFFIKKYLVSADDRKCRLTAFGEKNGGYKSISGDGAWLLRSSGKDQNFVANVSVSGYLNTIGCSVDLLFYSVRPAIWIDLKD